MVSKDCVAMILAGGQGSRLGALTKNVAKPAVPSAFRHSAFYRYGRLKV